MEDKNSTTETLVNSVRALVDDYKSLAQLKVIDKASVGLSAGIIGFIFLVFFSLVLAFLGFALAWWIGEAMGNMKAGFFIVSGFFALMVGILIMTASKGVIPLFRNLIIKFMYNDDNND